jgi:hypothetical protein
VIASFRDGYWTPTYIGTEEWLQNVVYYSFSKLSEEAQNMFLDSVSVLLGQPKHIAMLVWEALWPNKARQALRMLKQLSLISITNDRITALDVIRSLGQSIILKDNRVADGKYVGSRVWTRNGDVQGLIKV